MWNNNGAGSISGDEMMHATATVRAMGTQADDVRKGGNTGRTSRAVGSYILYLETCVSRSCFVNFVITESNSVEQVRLATLHGSHAMSNMHTTKTRLILPVC